MAIDLSQKKKIAFVCSGGVVKAAAFHIGVATALDFLGFNFKGGVKGKGSVGQNYDPSRTIGTYVGSSAGCLITMFLAQGGKISDLQSIYKKSKDYSTKRTPLKYWEMIFPRIRNRKYTLGKKSEWFDLLKLRSLSTPFSTDGIIRYFQEHVILSENFSDLVADLFVVTTDVNSSRKVIFSKFKTPKSPRFSEYRNDVNISDACAASLSLPPLYHPFRMVLDGQERDLYDGEIKEPLNVHVATDMDCDLIICSHTHMPVKYPSRRGSLVDKGIMALSLQAIYQMIERKIQVARGTRAREKKLIDTVKKFFKEKELPDNMRDLLVEELEARMSYKSHIDYIYIHPRPSDVEMFNMPHFSLNEKTMERIVRKGYIATYKTMKGLKVNK